MAEITELLKRAEAGDEASLGRVFAELYPELRRIAQARLRQDSATLTPTALVHDTFLKMTAGAALSLENRRHFFTCAARAMRLILVDHSRRAASVKRGGDRCRVTLDDDLASDSGIDLDVLALDRALDQLKQRRREQSEVVELHCFAGLNFADIAALMECSESTAKRHWSRARAYLHAQIEGCAP
ncbi:MAG: ECF-type sigma factor [Rhodanobacteraceae bacterium]